MTEYKPMPKRIDLMMDDTCTCGHAWYHHEFGGLLSRFGSHKHMGKCEECKCSKYEHLGISSWMERYTQNFSRLTTCADKITGTLMEDKQ